MKRETRPVVENPHVKADLDSTTAGSPASGCDEARHSGYFPKNDIAEPLASISDDTRRADAHGARYRCPTGTENDHPLVESPRAAASCRACSGMSVEDSDTSTLAMGQGVALFILWLC